MRRPLCSPGRSGVLQPLSAAVMGAIVLRVPGVRPFPWRSVAIVAVAALAMWATIVALLEVTWWGFALLGGVPVYLALLHLLRVDGPGGLRKVWHDSHFHIGESGFEKHLFQLRLAKAKPLVRIQLARLFKAVLGQVQHGQAAAGNENSCRLL